MKYIETEIPDIKILEPQVFGDDRGFFMETFRADRFSEHCGHEITFVQDNHSKSKQGILRGLHYQSKHAQGKLVRVTQGEVYDIAVDMRKESKTFGEYVGITLSESNKRQLWVPKGFAHGFYVMSEYAEFVYKCTDYYSPDYEVSLRWDDPTLSIPWPLVNGAEPLLSQKDQEGLLFNDAPYF